MQYKDIGGIRSSLLVLGSMRIADKPLGNVRRLIDVALDMGVNTFDHADIYSGGACEELYGRILRGNGALRSRMVLQTKCGVRGGWYDLSFRHIIDSVDGSLKRLCTDYLDILLLHRPDALMRPEEIARAFDELESSGKVRVFGVSNFSAQQIEYLASAVNQPLYINQLRLNLTDCPLIDAGLNGAACGGDSIEYYRNTGMTVQAYGAMQCAFTDQTGYYYSGAFTTAHARKKYFSLNFMLEGLAEKYNTTPEAVAARWIIAHPAAMQAVIGTTLDTRLALYRDCCEVPLSNYEWYKLYEAAGHKIP